MTSAQQRLIYILLTTVSGPVVNILARILHLGSDDVQLWLNLISAVTLAAGTAWGITSFTPTGVVQQASSLPPEQAAQALSQVSDEAKVLVAKSVPGVATVVVKDTAGDGLAQLANDPKQPDIVTETQNEADAKQGTKTP